MFNWLNKKRYVVATLLIGLDGIAAAPLLGVLTQASRRILDQDGEFEAASQEIAGVCGAVLNYETAWNRAGNWGEVFNKEEEAGDYGAENFSDLSQRYLASGGSDEDSRSVATIPAVARPPANIVVMVTVAYQGEVPELEATLNSVTQVKEALGAIVALHHKDQLQLAHLHYAPAHFGDDLNDDQLLVNYPELNTL